MTCDILAIMKYLSILLLLASISTAHADEWDGTDSALEVTYQVLAAVDWIQTRQIAKNPSYWEQNPLLGNHPSVSKVNEYFALTGLAHYYIATQLSVHTRHIFQGASISIEVSVIAHNYAIGLRTTF